MSKQAKMEWLANGFTKEPDTALELLKSYWHKNAEVQRLHDEFIENTISNFYMPYGVAPNFLINGKMYTLPLAIEESSVVAAAAKSANFWLERGGFKTMVIRTTKIGHVHFVWNPDSKNPQVLFDFFDKIKSKLFDNSAHITKNMVLRGGGVLDIQLVDKSHLEAGYFQLEVKFETCDSMGANFINSCLESFAETLKQEVESNADFTAEEKNIQIVMSILSNYTPECLVRAEVSCKIEEINEGSGLSNEEFASKFCRAIRIAEIEPYRAVTHNKGIMNGIDALVIATGNDFRAVEACAHAYASRSGKYSSLSHASVENGVFKFWIEIPLSLGTVGGITSLHPMVKFSHDILGHPNAQELMQIIAVGGLAQNFSAIRSLITSGIQKGHMKMHLLNILNQLEATPEEKDKIVEYFKDHVVSFSETVKVFCQLRGIPESTLTKQASK